MTGFTEREKDLVVVTTTSLWNEPPRIRHQITYQLCRFYNVLYIELFSRSWDRSFRKINDSLLVVSSGIYIKGLKFIFDMLPSIEVAYKKKIAKNIHHYITLLGYKKSKLVNFQFDFPEIYQSKSIENSIYLCNDDFINMGASLSTSKKKYLQIRQKEVIILSNTVLAVSVPLVDALNKNSANAELILPGVDIYPENTSVKHGIKTMEPNILRVAFMGYINHRLEINWLQELLEHEHINLELIGPIEDYSLRGLERYQNLILTPPLTGESLTNKLKEMDVLTIPYCLDNNWSKVITAPNKFFQYMAVGRPVVISDMPSFIFAPERFIYRARNAKEFVQSIYQAAKEDTLALQKSRINYAKQNSWNSRGDMLFKYLSL